MRDFLVTFEYNACILLKLRVKYGYKKIRRSILKWKMIMKFMI